MALCPVKDLACQKVEGHWSMVLASSPFPSHLLIHIELTSASQFPVLQGYSGWIGVWQEN